MDLGKESRPRKVKPVDTSKGEITLGQMLRNMKSTGTTCTPNSSYLFRNARSSALSKFNNAYQSFQTGQIDKGQFLTQVRKELGAQPGSSLYAVLDEKLDVDYYKILTALNYNRKPVERSYFRTSETHPMFRSMDQTVNTGAKICKMALTEQIQSFLKGDITKGELEDYCQQNHVPMTVKAKQLIQEHTQSESVPFSSLGKELIGNFNPTNRSLTPTPGMPASSGSVNQLCVQAQSETELHRRAEEEIRQQRALDTLGIRSAVRKKPRRKTDQPEILEWNDLVKNQELPQRTRTLHEHANIFDSEHEALIQQAQPQFSPMKKAGAFSYLSGESPDHVQRKLRERTHFEQKNTKKMLQWEAMG